MSIISGDILKVVATLVWDDGEINQNVFNAVVTGAGSPFADADILTDAEDWVSTMYANMVTGIDADLTGSHVTVYVFDPIDDDWDEVGQINWTFAPTGSAGTQLPRGVAGLINAKTSDPDVSGKKYLPGTIEGFASYGLWTAPFVTLLANFAADWVAGFVGVGSAADWQPVVWSVVGQVAKYLTGAVTIPTIPAYQRRRKNLVGI